MAKLGAHVSIVGGYNKALERIVAIGGNCLQIFSTPPRDWSKPKPDENDIKVFTELKTQLKVNPIFFHASYLINLANNEHVGRHSKQLLIAELTAASQLGIKGSIIHLGSFKNNEHNESEIPQEIQALKYDILIANIKEVLANSPDDTLFIIENSGTRKVGLTLDEIARIIVDVNDKRVRVCFDTCHLHAAGYNISTIEYLDKFLQIFDSFIGLNKLELWHLNDSKDAFGSRRDRHENIGKGAIGTEVFKLLLNHEKTKHLPFIIETPGFEEKGPDKENLDILKSLIEPKVNPAS